jgi:transcriptional regulator with XRE-family HTH domain
MKPAEPKPPRHPKEPVFRAAFARMLVQFRDAAELTQGQVGEKAGYEEKYIGKLERRQHTPTLTAVVQISNAVNVSPLEMLAGVMELLPRFAHLEGKPLQAKPRKTGRSKRK